MLTFNMLVLYHSKQFAMSHGSYDSNLGSEIIILILAGDIRSRSWPKIDGTYGKSWLKKVYYLKIGPNFVDSPSSFHFKTYQRIL